MFGIHVGTSWATLFIYDQLVACHRKQIKWICEIGTGAGCVTAILGIWADVWNLPMISIDNLPWPERYSYQPNPELIPKIKAQLLYSGVDVIDGDVFEDNNKDRICSLMQTGSGFLICDGGDKAKEVATFAPHAPSGTIVICHDYKTEVKPRQLACIPEVELYEPWHSQSLEMRTTAAVLRVL
jgi:hypothetical protein